MGSIKPKMWSIKARYFCFFFTKIGLCNFFFFIITTQAILFMHIDVVLIAGYLILSSAQWIKLWNHQWLMLVKHVSSRTEANKAMENRIVIVSLRPKFVWDVFCDHTGINVDQLGAICLLSLDVLKDFSFPQEQFTRIVYIS